MKRRWIIRSFFIGLLLLCGSGWVWSFAWNESIIYGGSRIYIVDMFRGKLRFYENLGRESWWPGWSYDHSPASDPNILDDADKQRFWGGTRFLGFYYNHRFPMDFSLSVPLWLPTSVGTLMLWLVWRKTRPKPVGRAFPVEVKQSHAKEEKTP